MGFTSVSDCLVGLSGPHRTNRTEIVTDHCHCRRGTGSGLLVEPHELNVGRRDRKHTSYDRKLGGLVVALTTDDDAMSLYSKNRSDNNRVTWYY
jgi:hypothetical protein